MKALLALALPLLVVGDQQLIKKPKQGPVIPSVCFIAHIEKVLQHPMTDSTGTSAGFAPAFYIYLHYPAVPKPNGAFDAPRLPDALFCVEDKSAQRKS